MLDTIEYAQQKDREDKLHSFRSRFFFPRHPLYFCGNSLGLQPKSVEQYLQQELADWRDKAIDGYWQAANPWMTYPQSLRGPLARIVGGGEDEITVMNALTVNLHLFMLTFYRPTPARFKILIEAGAFPSDRYAVETQIRWHGYDPATAIVEIEPEPGGKLIAETDILAAIGSEPISLVLLGGLNYYTGQLFDMAAITATAHREGAMVGFDLAHAVGNVPLRLHDWNVDFAVWCSYKYLNGGPGAAGGAFVHERHAKDTSLIRLGGWWGNDQMARFQTDHQNLPTGQNTERGFIPKPTAEGWSMSTAQVFNMAALKASLSIFEDAGFENLVAKSRILTGYLHDLLKTLPEDFTIITPAEPQRRGAQLSLYFGSRGKAVQQTLQERGVVVDYREPGVIRVSPAPLYNSFEDVYRFYHILRDIG